MIPMRSTFIAFTFLLLIVVSCKKNDQPEAVPADGKDSYYSIKLFAKDQWEVYRGMPFGIQKVVYANGKADTTYTDAFKMDWGTVLKTFFESDISDKKYLGRYDFTTFYDDATETRNFYYEAKDDDLYTRKLQISAADYNKPVQSIYIETAKRTKWTYRTQRLFYMPRKIISIQEFEQSKSGPGKEVRIEYRFM